MSNEAKESGSYRDRVATIDESGKRVWIFPKKPSGNLHRWRAVTAVILLAFLFIAPLIKVNGRQLILLNILKREFVLFGVAFWPQDFHLFVIATITLIVFIILFTVVFGRIWCGWACPQTIFMEMVFRKIEYWIEGDASAQRKLKAAPWDAEKIFKKSFKHIIFYALSFLIGNTFLAYIIGSDRLFQIMSEPVSEHLVGLIAMLIFSGMFYFIFAFFREQACTMVCPYGRLQGVLLDTKSIVVHYDFLRGEDRGKFSKKQDRKEAGLGDCVDCHRCVDVCPTGIDIRNGTQLECVNCTACIDACDDVMTKLKMPKGLIRFASFDGIKKGEKLRVTPRIIGYTAVLILLMTVLTVMLFTRSPIETSLLRTPGVLCQETPDGKLSNLYNVKIVNKMSEDMKVEINVVEPEGGRINIIGGELNIPHDHLGESALFIELPKDKVNPVKTQVSLEIYGNGELMEEIQTSFIGPGINK